MREETCPEPRRSFPSLFGGDEVPCDVALSVVPNSRDVSLVAAGPDCAPNPRLAIHARPLEVLVILLVAGKSKVIRVDARPVVANVVDVHIRRDLPPEYPVREPVYVGVVFSVVRSANLSVSIRADPFRPDSALAGDCRTLHEVLPEVLVPRAALLALAVGDEVRVSVLPPSLVVHCAHSAPLCALVALFDLAGCSNHFALFSLAPSTNQEYHVTVWKGARNVVRAG